MRGLALPLPLLVVPIGPRLGVRARAGIAIAAILLLGIGVLFTCTASRAPSLAAFVAFVVIACVAVNAIVGAIRARIASPGGAARGVYLFPFDLVDARTSRVRVYALAGVREVSVRNRHADRGGGVAIEIDFADGATCALVVETRAIADELRGDIASAVRRIEALSDSGELASVAAFHAFHDLHESVAPADAKVARHEGTTRPIFAVASWCAAMALGAYVGATTFAYAKTSNDDLRFARARTLHTASAYQEYLSSGGGRYEAEVNETLLPCAELRALLPRTTSLSDFAPLATFVQKYPASYCTDAAKSVLAHKVDGVRVAFDIR